MKKQPATSQRTLADAVVVIDIDRAGLAALRTSNAVLEVDAMVRRLPDPHRVAILRRATQSSNRQPAPRRIHWTSRSRPSRCRPLRDRAGEGQDLVGLERSSRSTSWTIAVASAAWIRLSHSPAAPRVPRIRIHETAFLGETPAGRWKFCSKHHIAIVRRVDRRPQRSPRRHRQYPPPKVVHAFMTIRPPRAVRVDVHAVDWSHESGRSSPSVSVQSSERQLKISSPNRRRVPSRLVGERRVEAARDHRREVRRVDDRATVEPTQRTTFDEDESTPRRRTSPCRSPPPFVATASFSPKKTRRRPAAHARRRRLLRTADRRPGVLRIVGTCSPRSRSDGSASCRTPAPRRHPASGHAVLEQAASHSPYPLDIEIPIVAADVRRDRAGERESEVDVFQDLPSWTIAVASAA